MLVNYIINSGRFYITYTLGLYILNIYLNKHKESRLNAITIFLMNMYMDRTIRTRIEI